MPDRKKRAISDDLKSAFDLGYANASSSLRTLKKDKVSYNNFHQGFYKLDAGYRFDQDLFSRKESAILITTEIFGDLSGKSYLLISDKEFDSLTHQIQESTNPGINLKEEFVKELDNILSASVITELSNELNLKAYGDVPILIGKMGGPIEDIIYDDFGQTGEELYVTSIYFSFEREPSINPRFIWVLNLESLKDPTNSSHLPV